MKREAILSLKQDPWLPAKPFRTVIRRAGGDQVESLQAGKSWCSPQQSSTGRRASVLLDQDSSFLKFRSSGKGRLVLAARNRSQSADP
ncbi:hypothetical protein CU100_17270 [Phyllobacterium endophyticum]|uniref:Uncharacterized protein n=1 Tax=Phyllobacterium endophyticum TaxID=1149773 RepID=A0A2P7AS30_9HYPH|nr:hypothetical protein CU100_17270 [Phyllobacterium endophyticum]